MRKSNLCLILFAGCLLLLGGMFFHAAVDRRAHQSIIAQCSRLTKTLELTDLCLFTEARYTRHLSQADLHSAFQDHPFALEHFPAGSIAGPPAHLRKSNERLD